MVLVPGHAGCLRETEQGKMGKRSIDSISKGEERSTGERQELGKGKERKVVKRPND